MRKCEKRDLISPGISLLHLKHVYAICLQCLVEITYTFSEELQEFNSGANFGDKISDSVLIVEMPPHLCPHLKDRKEDNMT